MHMISSSFPNNISAKNDLALANFLSKLATSSLLPVHSLGFPYLSLLPCYFCKCSVLSCMSDVFACFFFSGALSIFRAILRQPVWALAPIFPRLFVLVFKSSPSTLPSLQTINYSQSKCLTSNLSLHTSTFTCFHIIFGRTGYFCLNLDHFLIILWKILSNAN